MLSYQVVNCPWVPMVLTPGRVAMIHWPERPGGRGFESLPRNHPKHGSGEHAVAATVVPLGVDFLNNYVVYCPTKHLPVVSFAAASPWGRW